MGAFKKFPGLNYAHPRPFRNWTDQQMIAAMGQPGVLALSREGRALYRSERSIDSSGLCAPRPKTPRAARDAGAWGAAKEMSAAPRLPGS